MAAEEEDMKGGNMKDGKASRQRMTGYMWRRKGMSTSDTRYRRDREEQTCMHEDMGDEMQ